MVRFIEIIITLILLGGCDSIKPKTAIQPWSTEGKTMGTYYRVLVVKPPIKALIGLKESIEQQLTHDNYQMSTWQVNTFLSKFNRYYGTNPQSITQGMADIISTSLRIGAKTGGAMDITVTPLVNLWGFGPEKKPIKTPNIKQIKHAKKRVGFTHLRLIETSKGNWLQKLVPNICVDLSTVGEGYATDHLAALLDKRGITRYLVSVGGAIFTSGLSSSNRPWRVAIQRPTDKTIEIETIVNLQGYGISTSGSYRNYYNLNDKRLNHIINPATGKPIDHQLVSVTVIARTALEADGLDTGLMVLGTEKAKKLVLREGWMVFLIIKTNQGFTTWVSPQFSSFIASHINNDL